MASLLPFVNAGNVAVQRLDKFREQQQRDTQLGQQERQVQSIEDRTALLQQQEDRSIANQENLAADRKAFVSNKRGIEAAELFMKIKKLEMTGGTEATAELALMAKRLEILGSGVGLVATIRAEDGKYKLFATSEGEEAKVLPLSEISLFLEKMKNDNILLQAGNASDAFEGLIDKQKTLRDFNIGRDALGNITAISLDENGNLKIDKLGGGITSPGTGDEDGDDEETTRKEDAIAVFNAVVSGTAEAGKGAFVSLTPNLSQSQRNKVGDAIIEKLADFIGLDELIEFKNIISGIGINAARSAVEGLVGAALGIKPESQLDKRKDFLKSTTPSQKTAENFVTTARKRTQESRLIQ